MKTPSRTRGEIKTGRGNRRDTATSGLDPHFPHRLQRFWKTNLKSGHPTLSCDRMPRACLIGIYASPVCLNPPDGNRGIVQVQPTPASEASPNPPDGNRGIVKVRPSLLQNVTAPGAWKAGPEPSPDCHRGDSGKCCCSFRSDLNHPPIAIGGISVVTTCVDTKLTTFVRHRIFQAGGGIFRRLRMYQ